MTNKLIGRQCMFSFHIPANKLRKDTHVIKEKLHYADGTTKPNMRVLTDFKRPFWITKKIYRDHKDKKVSEDLVRLDKFTSTQSDLGVNINNKLGWPNRGSTDLNKAMASPYTYGLTADSKVYIKHLYSEKWPDLNARSTTCVLDIEKDTVEKVITLITIAMEGAVFTAVNKILLGESHRINLSDKITYLYNKHIGEVSVGVGKVTPEVVVCDSEIDLLKITLLKLHSWKPDFVAVWNINYDMTELLNVCNRDGVDPKDIFSDPSLPRELRSFEYVRGRPTRTTASGKVVSLSPERIWNYVNCPATFYWIDAMVGYRLVRLASKELSGGVSLDNVLKKELGENSGKLYFEDENINKLKGIDWHKYMTKERPLEYLIYNQSDCVKVLELDKHTLDLQQTIPMLAGESSLFIFGSGPKRIVDALHFHYLSKGKVLGVKGGYGNKIDTLLGADKWIMMLVPTLMTDIGKKLFPDNKIRSNTRTFVYDSDQVSAYPSNGQAANISCETTVRELKNIEGIPKEIFKHRNIDLMFGEINAIEYATTMYGLPTLKEIITILDS